MPIEDEEYDCALSGTVGEPGLDEGDEGDGLGDLPLGWTEVTIRRRRVNPEWLTIQILKEQMVHGMLIFWCLLTVPSVLRNNTHTAPWDLVRGPMKALTATVEERSYSPTMGETREERKIGVSGSFSSRIAAARSSWAPFR